MYTLFVCVELGCKIENCLNFHLKFVDLKCTKKMKMKKYRKKQTKIYSELKNPDKSQINF